MTFIRKAFFGMQGWFAMNAESDEGLIWSNKQTQIANLLNWTDIDACLHATRASASASLVCTRESNEMESFIV